MSNRLWDAIDLNHYAEDQRYKFLTASVVPRPIALVTSMGRRGVVNAAPFSQFVIICITPPLLGIVVHHVANIEKDTLSNIRDSAEFVINSVSETMAQQVQQCAEFYPRDISEAEQVGFHLIASKLVRTPRIAESVVQFECRLHRLVQFGVLEAPATLIVGEVVLAHCAQGMREGHRIDHAQLQPLGRISGRNYCRTHDVISV